MKRNLYLCVALFTASLLTVATFAQGPRGRESNPDPFSAPDIKLPSGKSQRDEILKSDHKKNQEDSVKLAALTAELKDELEQSDSHVVSVKMLKKLDDIEKLARSIRGRLRRN
jgi:hypothetical protein